MRAPGFWWRVPPTALARLLQPLGALYGAVTMRRMRQPGAQAGIPVICVGNFVAGGAGKTPTTLALAARLVAMGETPFALTRGYGGKLPGPLRVDLARHISTDVGDEPLLLAARLPTIVARKRPAGAALACGSGASLVLMDDGLQNPSLHKDLRLAVVDGAVGVGNSLCLPAGPLRAPLGGQIEQIDAIVLIGEGPPGDDVATQALTAGKPVLRARLAPPATVEAELADLPVLAVSGIGRPEKFVTTLRAAGARLVGEHAYGDHHAYTAGEVAALIAEAKAKACCVAVTEKDMVKLAPLWPAAERSLLLCVPVTLAFEDEAALDALLRGCLAKTRSGAAGATHAQ
ncbi:MULTISPECIES: tetraacyldisaccharide 4'-kinase [unclassified Bosea (in: a-proteobacteria)]|uniref:tetraacyldisaccharide 4'-kinase n=1 Tax=unclassified Bosea (in: a-proteobacteria) TaxID=2653178 RepID=UPI000F754788|nr:MULTISPECIES: tetraacyldisaccharide 4'-kinase [unclassified Bosea (in: a-proteobacteria)]AZO78783.1 tetraacyldisaccharide 4'-kinase [Bosea sp. Tri-49]RXT17428.1 tetraacyldisaccharide 4'-kinase [Bosea sp. Tri-39]RXT40800.1 tetraacyldisaccharide 4'-kinase [Bosea sp. Tri-54]